MPRSVGNSEMDIHHMSLERLLQLSFGYSLVNHYRLFSSRVELFLSDGTLLACNPIEARFFLRGLIYGYLHRQREMGAGPSSLPESNPPLPIS